MKKILGKASKLKDMMGRFLEEHKTTIKFILRDNFNRDFLSKIKNEEFFISQDNLEHHIYKAVEDEKDIDHLDSVYCTPEGVHVTVYARKYNAKVKVKFCLYIKALKFTRQHQFIIFQFHSQKISGTNLTGFFASVVAETLLEGIIAKSVLPEEIIKSIHYRKDHTAAVVNLRELEIVDSLKKPLFGTSKSVLDFISVIGARHSYAGITLKIKALSFLRK